MEISVLCMPSDTVGRHFLWPVVEYSSMASIDDVKRLAALARVSISEKELPDFVKEFESILAYVGQIEALQLSKEKSLLPLRNVMRKDDEPHEKGTWTKKLVEQFPERDGNYLRVKKIISHD
jgi:aspartyl-tRNA(Asn)/glutamyl-tRNA(Gln) amidotransferase subunit C